MTIKYCNACRAISATEASYCFKCGRKLLTSRSFGKRHVAILETAELLIIAGSFIVLLGGIIGIALSTYFADLHGFTPVTTTFFITNFFALSSVVFSGSGLILIIKKKLKQKTENSDYLAVAAFLETDDKNLKILS
jgi:hypothetical protein